MRLAWTNVTVKNYPVKHYLFALTYPNGKVVLYSRVKYPDGLQQEKETSITAIHPFLVPIAQRLLLRATGDDTSSTIVQDMTDYLSLPDVLDFISKSNWTNVNFGPWVKTGPSN